jgi:hypothetical protein
MPFLLRQFDNQRSSSLSHSKLSTVGVARLSAYALMTAFSSETETDRRLSSSLYCPFVLIIIQGILLYFVGSVNVRVAVPHMGLGEQPRSCPRPMNPTYWDSGGTQRIREFWATSACEGSAR